MTYGGLPEVKKVFHTRYFFMHIGGRNVLIINELWGGELWKTF